MSLPKAPETFGVAVIDAEFDLGMSTIKAAMSAEKGLEQSIKASAAEALDLSDLATVRLQYGEYDKSAVLRSPPPSPLPPPLLSPPRILVASGLRHCHSWRLH
jgi:hypothetical protein